MNLQKNHGRAILFHYECLGCSIHELFRRRSWQYRSVAEEIMARPRTAHPTPAEWEMRKVLWDRGPLTVREVLETLNQTV